MPAARCALSNVRREQGMKTVHASALACCAVLAAPAAATITIYSSPGAVNPDENVLFGNADQTGTTIIGTTNQTSTLVNFLGDEELQTTAAGQANLTATDGGFTTLSWSLDDASQGFLEAEFNVLVGQGSATSITVSFEDQFGNLFSDTFELGNGQNFIGARATDGQLITRASFTTDGTIEDARQFRLGGFADVGVIPEPATWAMLVLGFGAVGNTLRRRRQAFATSLN